MADGQNDGNIVSRGLGALANWLQTNGYWGNPPAGGQYRNMPPTQQQQMNAATTASTPQAAPGQVAPTPQGRVTMQFAPPGQMQMTPWQYNLQRQQQFAEDYKKNPDAYIVGYRHNENPKLKSPIETVPTYYPVAEVKPFLSAYKIAKNKFGVPDIGADRLAAMALAEGREDFGYNRFDRNNPKVMELYENLKSMGIPDRAAGFAAAIKEKSDVAQRLKIPFEKAWNGTGTSKYGKTGDDYVDRVRKNRKALQHKDNSQIREFMRQNALLEEQDAPEVAAAKKGGSIGKPLPGGNKII